LISIKGINPELAKKCVKKFSKNIDFLLWVKEVVAKRRIILRFDPLDSDVILMLIDEENNEQIQWAMRDIERLILADEI